MKKVLGAFALLVVLASCTTFHLVEPKRQQVGRSFSVEPQIQWSKYDAGWMEMWTVDGASLAAVRFYKGLKDGSPMFMANEGQTLPTFRSKMRAGEIREFVVDSLTQTGANKVKAGRLSPARFGGHRGFRFELSFLTDDGLAMNGIATGTVIDGELQLIFYTGASVHYFGRYKAVVERMMTSVQTS